MHMFLVFTYWYVTLFSGLLLLEAAAYVLPVGMGSCYAPYLLGVVIYIFL